MCVAPMNPRPITPTPIPSFIVAERATK
jgi:hypothetical protein